MAHTLELIAFDLGNVLANVDEGRAARELAVLTGRPESAVLDAVFCTPRKTRLETGRWTWGRFVEEALWRLGAPLDEQRFREAFCLALSPNEPIFPLVERVRARYPTALCSNTSPAHWDWARARIPFADRLDPIILSYEIGCLKPERAVFDALSERSGVPGERILFIDDLEENVEGARAAGLRAIQFYGVDRLRDDLEAAGVDAG